MTQLYRNNAVSTLASSITSGDLSIALASGTGVLFPAPGAGESFQATLRAPSGALEIVTCTGRTSDTLTVVRAQEGTTALAFDAGAVIEMCLTRAIMENLPQKDTANVFAENTTFQKDVAVAQSVTVTQNMTVNGNTTLGNAPTDTITVVGKATFQEPIIGNLTGRADVATLADSATNATTAVNLTGSWSAIPAGTKMLFQQTAAPPGWTKDVTHDNKALRIVSGAVGSGGTLDFTAAFASRTPSGSVGATTLSTAQMPSHSHSFAVGAGSGASAVPNASDGSGGPTGSTNSAGGGGSHTHSFTGTAIDFAVKYVDTIIATKD